MVTPWWKTDQRVEKDSGPYASLPDEHTPAALVVDDDQSTAGVIARAVESWGWKSVVAASGQAALEEAKCLEFDLILLDLVMPGMNGVDTFREIRKIDSRVQVVIVTAYPDSDLMSEALEVGPFAVIKKPFRLDEAGIVLQNVRLRHDKVA